MHEIRLKLIKKVSFSRISCIFRDFPRDGGLGINPLDVKQSPRWLLQKRRFNIELQFLVDENK